MRLILALLILALPLALGAQVYEIRDESGKVIGYSDKPPAGDSGAQPIEVSKPNTAAPPPDIPRPPPPPAKEEKHAYKVNITNPATETVIPQGPGNFTVDVRVTPALHENDRLQLFVDGVAWGEPQRAPHFALVNVYRGAHDIMIRAVNADGDNLGESDSIKVYVRRPMIRN